MQITMNDIPFVKLDSMNETHAESLELLNQIYNLIEDERANDNSALILNQIKLFFNHTLNHFAQEEQMMRDHNFHAYGCHKEAHDTELEKIFQVIMAFEKTLDLNILNRYFKEDLPEWFNSHVSTMDYATAEFISDHLSS